MEGCVELMGGRIEFFKELNNTKFALPQSEILERSEVRRSEASLRELCTS